MFFQTQPVVLIKVSCAGTNCLRVFLQFPAGKGIHSFRSDDGTLWFVVLPTEGHKVPWKRAGGSLKMFTAKAESKWRPRVCFHLLLLAWFMCNWLHWPTRPKESNTTAANKNAKWTLYSGRHLITSNSKFFSKKYEYVCFCFFTRFSSAPWPLRILGRFSNPTRHPR